MHQTLVDLVNTALSVNCGQLAALPVKLDERLGPLSVNLQAIADGLLVVVFALDQLPARLDALVELLR